MRDANRVKETTTTTGTANLTLAGAVAGFQTFINDAYISTGNYVPYTLLDANGTGWEVGYGLLSASTTLERSFVLNSSAGVGTKITLSAGTHTVLIGAMAELRKTQGLLTSLTGTLPDDTWTDLTMQSVGAGSRPNKYDTSVLLATPVTSLTLPAWVERIRVNARVNFVDSTDLASGGELFLVMTHLDNTWDDNGMPRDHQPSALDANRSYQMLQINSGIIDVPNSGGNGFKIRAKGTVGQTLSIVQAWLAVEFIE